MQLQGSLSPCALAKDFVQVQGHGVLGNQALNFFLQVAGQDPHHRYLARFLWSPENQV
jgi:hypothetical protein